MLKEEFVIIGAGVAGLCAANRLADLGKHSVVIEGGEYPVPKVCGEFLSPECLDYLRSWDIKPAREIKDAHFYAGSHHMHFTLPISAASMPHMQRDRQLLDYAQRNGVDVLLHTKVVDLRREREGYVLHLSNGQVLQAGHLLIATGRLPQFHSSPPQFPYVGIKNHIKGVHLKNRIEMYAFQGAYIGLVAIDEDTANVVCLAERNQLERVESAETLVRGLVGQYPTLYQYFEKSTYGYSEWLTCKVPAFGIKMPSLEPRVYFLGDAAGSIPPVTGDGVAMAVSSGVMAAECASYDDAKGYRTRWLKQHHKHMRWGQLLHRIMLSPRQVKCALRICASFPKLSNFLFLKTRTKLY